MKLSLIITHGDNSTSSLVEQLGRICTILMVIVRLSSLLSNHWRLFTLRQAQGEGNNKLRVRSR